MIFFAAQVSSPAARSSSRFFPALVGGPFRVIPGAAQAPSDPLAALRAQMGAVPSSDKADR